MNIEQYSLQSDSSHLTYRFESIGPRGVIKKLVYYRKLKSLKGNYYNLSFGDKDEITGILNDLVISNNYDTSKVLFTVAQTVLLFVKHYPNANILIIGSTKSRTRLYQMTIAQNISEINKQFEIQGLKNGNWEDFRKGINFDSFLIKVNKRKL
jgi:hypothetical protein